MAFNCPVRGDSGVFNPVVSGETTPNTSYIVGAKDATGVNGTNVGNVFSTATGKAQEGPDLGVINVDATVSGVVGIADADGLLSIDLGVSGIDDVSAGDVIYVDVSGNSLDSSGANLEGSYYILSISGTSVITSTEWTDCLDASGATWGKATASLDVSLGLNTNTGGCDIPSQPSVAQSHKVNSYVNNVYTECWDCFCGTIDPCSITTTVVTLWTDESDVNPKIYYADGGKTLEGSSSISGRSPGTDNPAGQNKT